MKKYLLILSCILTGSMFKADGQVTETVSIGAGYANQVYYSLQNGASPAVSNTDWDLGFQLRGFAASIMVNAKNNVKVYRANKSIFDWGTMTTGDTTGILNSTYELYNSDESWDAGALSGTYDTSNAFDLGWGVYDFVTHIVSGDSVYFIQLSTGDYKKLWIESLANGIFNFRWADLDGGNEVLAQLDKTTFTSKYFGYFSITNNVVIDREPVIYNQWDLLFTQYLSLTPFKYLVAGVLSNDSVFVAKAYPVDAATATPAGYALSEKINTIGYDWKTYDFSNNVWTIEDSLVYFVKDRNAGMWKVIFTGFGGSANGDYTFTKEYLGIAGISENSINPLLAVYPNPATDNINMIIARQGSKQNTVLRIINATGAIVREFNTDLNNELSTVSVNLSGLEKGIYLLAAELDGKISTRTFVVQ